MKRRETFLNNIVTLLALCVFPKQNTKHNNEQYNQNYFKSSQKRYRHREKRNEKKIDFQEFSFKII